MGPKSEFWKEWWDNSAKNASSDYVLNRGTSIRLADLEQRAEAQLIMAVAPQPADTILDAGCGSGRNLSMFASRVRRIVGVDFSFHMLARARIRIEEEQLSNVAVRQASIGQLPFVDNTFDKVLCISVLQYLDDEECRGAFRELFRVCKNDGRIVAHIKNGSSLYGFSKWCANRVLRLLGRRGLPEYYRRRSVHVRMIRECGGRVLEIDSFGIFTCVGMPSRLAMFLIRLEMKRPKWSWLTQLGVNYKVTIAVAK
jgi:ubiquinone/menaquinone biosynthesis C-methylase UbiE